MLAEAVVAQRAPAILAGGRSIALENLSTLSTPRQGYPGAITLALENLVDNAVRHTRTGTTIIVRVNRDGSVSVLDDGEGIPVEHLTRLKERFWRADGPRSEGSGIGLSIVDRVARARHGILNISPRASGSGLEFRMTLGLSDRLAS
ncbi:hypothetical protein HMP09_0819 [Sphingomonas sp. HMP9]|uniref:sensor histidine kinase n=1 Tax=Sphingomonas sp. HMP9 TaxID=1517554 RepID=UPI00159A58AC|nr:ATP-binding protein [Sphingomonas sp. HMP9]BCA61585.1 hypothetical protein HMP09_0819 [Sphingomonas sp. HMP9]